MSNYERKRSAAGALGRETKRNRQTTLAEMETGQKSKVGDVFYKGDFAKMPLPKTAEGGKRPCGAYYRNGAFSCFGPCCKFDHTPIDSLGAEEQKGWIAPVRRTDGMSFNPARVKYGIAAVNRAAAEKKDSDKDGDRKPAAK